MHQQVGDFLELAGGGDVENVIATVVQIVAAAPHGAQGGVAGGGAAQGYGFLRLEANGGGFYGSGHRWYLLIRLDIALVFFP